MEKPTLKINLDDLDTGHPAITKAWGDCLGEAAKVCLNYHNHESGVNLVVSGIKDVGCEITWNGEVTSDHKKDWNDMQDATEFGACGVAAGLVLELTEYTIIERSIKGTGFDYWLGDKNADLPFQNSARLEISGILKGNEAVVKARVKQKTNQTAPTDKGNLPAFIIVVEFSEPKAVVEKK